MYILSADAGKRFEAFYDRNEDLFQQMDRDGRTELLGMIGKSAVRNILIALKFCVNGLSNTGQSCQIKSRVTAYTLFLLEIQQFSVYRKLSFEN